MLSMGHNKPPEDNENDKVTSVELLQRNRRVLHFSDGTMEESFDSENEGNIDAVDMAINSTSNENESFMPHLKRKLTKVSSNILAGIDYVGGGLATLFGITSPHYDSQIDGYKRNAATGDFEANIDERDNGTWRQLESGNSNNKVTPNDVICSDHKQDAWSDDTR